MLYVGLFFGTRRHGSVSDYTDENGNFGPPRSILFFYFSESRTANKILFCVFYPIHMWLRPSYFSSVLAEDAYGAREGGWFRIVAGYYLYDTCVLGLDCDVPEPDREQRKSS